MINSPPTVAVLLATHNGMQWLSEQLTSIQRQQGVQTKLFISDDNSTDGTRQWLQDQVQDQVHLLPAMQFGKASTNFFRLLMDIDLTDIDFVAFSDQDDIWLENKLRRATDTLLSRQVDAYSTNVTAFWPDQRQQLIAKAQPQQTYDFVFESAGPGCTFVLSRKLAQALQSFLRAHRDSCEQIALHDWFFYAFARSRGYQWYIDPVPSLLYRQHASNVFGANSGFRAMLARLVKLRRGWYLQQVLLLAEILGYQHTPLIQKVTRLNLLDRLVLAGSVQRLRRRLRDRFALAIYFLLIARPSCKF